MPNATLAARFVSKPNNLHDLNARAAEARPQPTRIKEVVELTAPEFDAYTAAFARKPRRGCKEVAGKGIKLEHCQFDNLLDPRRLRSRFRSARV